MNKKIKKGHRIDKNSKPSGNISYLHYLFSNDINITNDFSIYIAILRALLLVLHSLSHTHTHTYTPIRTSQTHAVLNLLEVFDASEVQYNN